MFSSSLSSSLPMPTILSPSPLFFHRLYWPGRKGRGTSHSSDILVCASFTCSCIARVFWWFVISLGVLIYLYIWLLWVYESASLFSSFIYGDGIYIGRFNTMLPINWALCFFSIFCEPWWPPFRSGAPSILWRQFVRHRSYVAYGGEARWLGGPLKTLGGEVACQHSFYSPLPIFKDHTHHQIVNLSNEILPPSQNITLAEDVCTGRHARAWMSVSMSARRRLSFQGDFSYHIPCTIQNKQNPRFPFQSTEVYACPTRGRKILQTCHYDLFFCANNAITANQPMQCIV